MDNLNTTSTEWDIISTKGDTLICVTIDTNLANSMISEKSQSQKDHMLYNLTYMEYSNEQIYPIES